MKNWKPALEDIQISLELDDKNIKANLICGQILLQLGKDDNHVNKVENGINKIKKALRLCSGQKKYDFEKQLVIYMLRGKKLLWYKNKEFEQQEG